MCRTWMKKNVKKPSRNLFSIHNPNLMMEINEKAP